MLHGRVPCLLLQLRCSPLCYQLSHEIYWSEKQKKIHVLHYINSYLRGDGNHSIQQTSIWGMYAKLDQDNFIRIVRWIIWYYPPDTGFEIRALGVWDQVWAKKYEPIVIWNEIVHKHDNRLCKNVYNKLIRNINVGYLQLRWHFWIKKAIDQHLHFGFKTGFISPRKSASHTGKLHIITLLTIPTIKLHHITSHIKRVSHRAYRQKTYHDTAHNKPIGIPTTIVV